MSSQSEQFIIPKGRFEHPIRNQTVQKIKGDKNMPLPMCAHPMCNRFYREHRAFGITVVLCDDDHVILGQERDGWVGRKDKYNVCMGHRDVLDKGCWVQTARAELWEEFRLELSEIEFFKIFGYWFNIGNAITFVLNANSVNFEIMNKSIIASHGSDRNSYNEMKQLSRIHFSHFDVEKCPNDINAVAFNIIRRTFQLDKKPVIAEKSIDEKLELAKKIIDAKLELAEKTIEAKLKFAEKTIEAKLDFAEKTIEAKLEFAEKTIEAKLENKPVAMKSKKHPTKKPTYAQIITEVKSGKN